MRLTQREKEVILTAIRAEDPNAKIYLYGSRVNSDSKGGDIDLIVFSERIDFSAKISLLTAIKQRIGEQKIDLLVKSSNDASLDPFVASVLKNAVELV